VCFAISRYAQDRVYRHVLILVLVLPVMHAGMSCRHCVGSQVRA
jgi:hypothetical protein